MKALCRVLIKADDETLLECLVMNADPEHDADFYEFDLKNRNGVPEEDALRPHPGRQKPFWRNESASAGRKPRTMTWTGRKISWARMEGGYENDRFASYWASDTDMTHPLILAKIPVKNPWEIFAWLPFGNWNDCPDTPQLMAAAKYWFERYGAVPGGHEPRRAGIPAPGPRS